MKDFLLEINQYEGRFKMFEKWYKRKETEIQNRGILAIRSLIKPDNTLHKIFRKKWERKYKGYCEKVFGQEYEKISGQELNIFVENFITRLYILKKCFPYSLAYILFGVLKHPNLNLAKKKYTIGKFIFV